MTNRSKFPPTRCFLLFVVGALLCGLPGRATGQGDADRATLETFFWATDGANWTNNTYWLTDAPISTWYGVTADANGLVTALRLGDNNLSGQLPNALGNLAYLENLWLSYNSLIGPIPAALGSLTDLEILNLAGNNLRGPIPNALGNLTYLRSLWLNNNRLSGPIPNALGNLTLLERLQLQHNRLIDPLPDGIGNLRNLQYLDISNTQACAPSAWLRWLETISFNGQLCHTVVPALPVVAQLLLAAVLAIGGCRRYLIR